MVTPQLVKEAFVRVGTERLALHNHMGLEIKARGDLAKAKADLIREGVEGSNQAQRDANLELLLTPERMRLEACQEQTREAQVKHEMAVLAIESLKWQIRAIEAVQTEAILT